MAIDRSSAEYWQKEISRSKEKRRDFISNFKQSIKVYQASHSFDDAERRLNCWWYVVSTLLPAYVSRTPKVEAELRNKSGSPIHNLVQLFLERSTQYQLDDCINFYKVAEQAANAFLLGGQAVLWVRYDSEISEKESRYSILRNSDDTGFIGIDGQPYTGEIAPIQDNDGMFSITEMIPSKEYEEVKLEYVHFEDYLTSVCRQENEISWKARRGYLSREHATEIFGKKVTRDLAFDSYPDDASREDRSDNKVEGKAAIWEVWSKEQNKVFFLQEGGKKYFESQAPELKFKGFYPCEEMNCGVDPDTTIPVSDYVHCKDQILEVEQLTTRMFACLRAIRSNALANATIGDEVKKIFSSDLQVLLMKNWATHKSAGGLNEQIEYQNIEPYVKALGVLQESRNDALERLYEMTKASDIMRGISDPQDTASAVQIKADWGSLSLKVRQKNFAEFLSRSISKVTEVISQQFDPQHIYDISDGDSIMSLAQNGETYEQVYEVIKDDPTRKYKVEITTDSLIILDERADRQERVDLMASYGSFLEQSVPFLEQYPSAAPFIMDMVQFVIRTYRAGKELEGPMMNMARNIEAEVQAKKQQQAQQQDPAQIDAQVRMQIAQMESQAKMQALQMQMQQDQAKFQHEQFLAQVEGQAKAAELNIEIEKLQLERMKLEVEINLRTQEMQLKQQEMVVSAQERSNESEIKSQAHAFEAINQQQKMELEKFKAQLTSYEQLIEEKRLSLDSAIQMAKLEQVSSKEQKLPPMNFNIHMPKGGKKKGVIMREGQAPATFEVGEDD